MKFGKVIRGALLTYIAIGVAVVLAQLLAPAWFEPDCAGTPRYTLSDQFRVVQIVTWLPNFYRETIRGEMTTRDFLLGGFRCESLRTVDLEYLRSLVEGVPRTQESISAIMKEAGKSPGDAPREPTRTKLGPDDGPTTIEVDGASFELPGNWVEIDREKVLANAAANVRILGGRQFHSPEVPATAIIRLAFVDSVEKNPPAADFAKKTIGELEKIGLTQVAVISAAEESVLGFPATRIALQGIDAKSRTWEYAVIVIQLPSRSLDFAQFYTLMPVSPHRASLERATNTLRIAR
jgi:hypothetical protein